MHLSSTTPIENGSGVSHLHLHQGFSEGLDTVWFGEG